MTTALRLPSLLDEILCTALGTGLVLVAVLPAAREVTAIGWMPMWLVGMPAVAWWALHGFAMPVRRARVQAVRRPRTSRAEDTPARQRTRGRRGATRRRAA